ncbi:MAG TPA: MerR family transcriptional regulator [Pseudonocardia sp.]|nr:MerR family transcriptional regulator [Pseudonocardia sp.]
MAEYRIDDLARAVDTSVRNVRYYQDNGMLPPPRRQGRVALYSEAHLARLRLIVRLLDRGYTAANIIELAGAWEQGRDLSDVLGLEQVVSGFFSEEIPGFLTAAEIHELFATPEVESGLIDKVVHAGLAAPDGDRYRIPSPRVLHALAELIKTGAPLGAVLELSGQLLHAIDDTVRALIGAVGESLLRDREQGWMPSPTELPEVAKLIRQVKPLAATAATAALNLSLDRHMEDILGDYIARLMPYLKQPGSEAGPHAALA